jgi:uncharacterized membrane-anchored protein YhcB (DUF1043 family)
MIIEKALMLVIGVVITMITWWCKTIWDNQKRLESNFSEHQLKLANDYKTKTEIDSDFQKLADKLDRLANLEILLVSSYVTKAELKDILSDLVDKITVIAKGNK